MLAYEDRYEIYMFFLPICIDMYLQKCSPATKYHKWYMSFKYKKPMHFLSNQFVLKMYQDVKFMDPNSLLYKVKLEFLNWKLVHTWDI